MPAVGLSPHLTHGPFYFRLMSLGSVLPHLGHSFTQQTLVRLPPTTRRTDPLRDSKNTDKVLVSWD